MIKIIRRLLNAFVSPLVSIETQDILLAAREALPKQYRTKQQFLGQQYAGCGATIGVMPRCDFACRSCYLGHEANAIPAESVAGIKDQLRVIQDWLGQGGNVQITDGEVTLRPIEELIEIIQYAREIGLVPMLMSHGDTLRKSPELLKRLILEGGLTELSIHIDTTQRGRSGTSYKHATLEQQLVPLRNEFAQLIRTTRSQTKQTLEVAMTYTVTENNIAAIPDIVRWLCQNSDAFKMISFQPVAQVGRTENQLGEVLSVDQLWAAIAEGLFSNNQKADELIRDQRFFGHPDCTRFIQGFVITEQQSNPVFHPLYKGDDKQAIQLINHWSERFGGINFRSHSRSQKVWCLLKILVQHPKFIFFSVLPFIIRRLGELDNRSAGRLLSAWLIGNIQINYLSIISHHFMNKEEIETPLGKERIDTCVFKVPINGSLISMCEVNALNYRKVYYESIRKAEQHKNINVNFS